MKILLDTHAALWWFFDDPRLSGTARRIIADRGNKIYLSSASVWEIATKYRIGKLDGARHLMTDLSGWIERADFGELPISHAHAERAGALPGPHRDPFDRMLIAQSDLEDMPVITRDHVFEEYGIRVIW